MSLPNGSQLDRGDVWKCRVKFTSKPMQMWSVVFSSSIEGISLKDPDQIKCDKNDIDVPLPPETNEITWFCSLHQKVIRLPEGHHWCLCHLKWDGMWHGPAWLIWPCAFATWKSWVTESCFPEIFLVWCLCHLNREWRDWTEAYQSVWEALVKWWFGTFYANGNAEELLSHTIKDLLRKAGLSKYAASLDLSLNPIAPITLLLWATLLGVLM